MQEARADLQFCQFAAEQLDYGALAAAAQVLVGLADERWLASVENAFRDRRALPAPPAGITGEVLLTRETSSGLIVIGGARPDAPRPAHRGGAGDRPGGGGSHRGRGAARSDAGA